MRKKAVHCRMPLFVVFMAKVGDQFNFLSVLIDQVENFPKHVLNIQ